MQIDREQNGLWQHRTRQFLDTRARIRPARPLLPSSHLQVQAHAQAKFRFSFYPVYTQRRIPPLGHLERALHLFDKCKGGQRRWRTLVAAAFGLPTSQLDDDPLEFCAVQGCDECSTTNATIALRAHAGSEATTYSSA